MLSLSSVTEIDRSDEERRTLAWASAKLGTRSKALALRTGEVAGLSSGPDGCSASSGDVNVSDLASDRPAEEALLREVPEVSRAPLVSHGDLAGLSVGPAGAKAIWSLLALRGLAFGVGDEAALAALLPTCCLGSIYPDEGLAQLETEGGDDK